MRLTRRGRDVEAVARSIKKRIAAGHLAPGHRLVEEELARAAGVSRGVVRQALRRLADEKLVDIAAYRGASVRWLSRADVNDVFDILVALGRAAVGLAAARIEERNNREIARDSLAATRRFRRRSRAVREVGVFIAENQRFHEVIRRLSGNRALAEIERQVEAQLDRLWVHGLAVGKDRAMWTRGHEEILLAILDGDARAAENAMKSYGRTIRAQVLSLPDMTFRPE
ncbi:MAG TPA: GntR family transcriptional regulator [Alphaproteobacteria bacterium]|nr:GntR family transcriptional regulator [Alphaproteobacteria bacterium]